MLWLDDDVAIITWWSCNVLYDTIRYGLAWWAETLHCDTNSTRKLQSTTAQCLACTMHKIFLSHLFTLLHLCPPLVSIVVRGFKGAAVHHARPRIANPVLFMTLHEVILCTQVCWKTSWSILQITLSEGLLHEGNFMYNSSVKSSWSFLHFFGCVMGNLAWSRC